MKVIAYIRVSTDEQDRSGLGLESQVEKIEAYCKLYDLDLIETFKDAASGKNMSKREGLLQALEVLRNGDAQGLIVAKLDRLTRSVRDLGYLLGEYFESKYSLIIVTEQIDTRTPTGRLIANILGSVGQWERETIAQRTADALQAKRARGEKCGGDVPYGFDADDAGLLTENPEEQHVITLIQELRGKGFSLRGICQELKVRGYRNRAGRISWKPMTISRILKAA